MSNPFRSAPVVLALLACVLLALTFVEANAGPSAATMSLTSAPLGTSGTSGASGTSAPLVTPVAPKVTASSAGPQLAQEAGQAPLPSPAADASTGPNAGTSANQTPLATLIASNETDHHGDHVILVPVPGVLSCPTSNVTICGQYVTVPASPLGTNVSLTVPNPYVHQPFTAQCTNINGIITYTVTNASSVTCALEACTPGAVSICGTQIPVSVGASVGSNITVSVPPHLLADAANGGDQTFTAQCMDNGGADPSYEVTDSSHITCNAFPCQDQNIRLCNVSIPLPGGTPMGGTLLVKMPDPYVHDSFTVQCVGSLGKAPVYQVVDERAVTCSEAAAPPPKSEPLSTPPEPSKEGRPLISPISAPRPEQQDDYDVNGPLPEDLPTQHTY